MGEANQSLSRETARSGGYEWQARLQTPCIGRVSLLPPIASAVRARNGENRGIEGKPPAFRLHIAGRRILSARSSHATIGLS